jgi:hypothetical protein
MESEDVQKSDEINLCNLGLTATIAVFQQEPALRDLDRAFLVSVALERCQLVWGDSTVTDEL